MNYEKFGRTLTMSDREIKEVVDGHMETIDAEAVIGMMGNIMESVSEEDRQVMESAPSIMKVLHVAQGMYKLGFLYGLYNYNGALKEEFAKMQALKVERVNKRKDK